MRRKIGRGVLAAVVGILVMVITDIAAANVYKLFNGRSWYAETYTPSGIEQQYRVKNAVYHYDLVLSQVNCWQDRDGGV